MFGLPSNEWCKSARIYWLVIISLNVFSLGQCGYPAIYPHFIQTDLVHTYNKMWGMWLKKGEKSY
jgi:hypothetical protein